LECQKQKQLVILKQSLDSTDQNSDPSGYEKARIAYFTLLNGQGWLAGEKNRIAKEDIEPVLANYSTKFNALKGEQQSNTMFTKLANVIKGQGGADKESNAFLKKQLNAEKDHANVSDRLNQLNSGGGGSSYIPIIMDVILTLLGVFVLYLLVSRFYKPASVVPVITNTGVL